MSKLSQRLCASLALSAVVGLVGCAHLPGDARGVARAKPEEIGPLRDHLAALAPTVSEDEAQRVAACAYDYSLELAREYRVVRPAWFHNFLVNTGFKKRGLCYQWTEDLLAKLETLELATLDLHWGMARWGTLREHNSVVVTARGQPFERGVALDPWRRSGRLVWKPVTEDKYPWVEGELISPPGP